MKLKEGLKDYVWLLDNGHGYNTAGKCSPDGVFREYLFNREVTDKVWMKLHLLGVHAVVLVPETYDVTLQERVNRANKYCDEYGTQNVRFVSIHANAAPPNDNKWHNAKGWCCFTTEGKTESDNLASVFYEAFEAAFKDRTIRKDMSDGDPDWEYPFYVCRKTKCPAVLLENFFYDNREEMLWLMSDQAKERIADAIVDGIMRYIAR